MALIEFHLDAGSGRLPVPAARAAGPARPPARPAAARATNCRRSRTSWPPLAINPNTVLRPTGSSSTRASSPRAPGTGPSSRGRSPTPSVAAHGPLRPDLERWLSKARRPASTTRASRPCSPTTFRASARAAHSVSAAALRAEGLTKRYGRRPPLADCTIEVPAGPRGRPRRPQRRGQEHAAEPRRRPARAERRHDRGAGRPALPENAGAAAPASASSRRDTPDLRQLQRPGPSARSARAPRPGRSAGARTDPHGSGSTWARRPPKLSGGQRAQLALTLGDRQAPGTAAARRAGGPRWTRSTAASSCRA